jgi:hypothetical protein
MDAELKLMIQSEVEINLIPQIVTMTSVCNELCVVVSIIRLSTELNWPIYRITITMWVVPQSTINPSLVIFLTDKRRINNPLVCFISFLTYFPATFILVLFSLSLHIFFLLPTLFFSFCFIFLSLSFLSPPLQTQEWRKEKRLFAVLSRIFYLPYFLWNVFLLYVLFWRLKFNRNLMRKVRYCNFCKVCTYYEYLY